MPAKDKYPDGRNIGPDGDAVVVRLSAGGQPLPPMSAEDPHHRLDDGRRRGPKFTPATIWRAAKLLAGGVVFAWLVAWPVGSTLVHVESTGTFGMRLGYSPEVFLFALLSAILILGGGFALAAGFKLEATAQRLTRSFGGVGTDQAHPSGAAAQRQVSALNDEIDRALGRLAEAESLIRQHVRALDSASSAIENGTVKSTERLERERNALMTLAEEMNREAESFADVIAERTKLSADEQARVEARIGTKERELESQIQRMESIQAKSLDRFEQLASAMETRSDTIKSASEESTERQTAIASQLEENTRRIVSAQSELSAQSTRLEELMQDQRKRAERLAKIVTDQASKLARSAQPNAPTPKPVDIPPPDDRPQGQQPSWRDILSTVETTMPASKAVSAPKQTPPAPKPPAPAPIPEEPAEPVDAMERLILRIQNFSLVMKTQLLSGPSHEELDRFERGERQLFARQLIDQPSDELKARIALEIDRNKIFAQAVADFLRDFDTLLEPLTAEEGSEAAIESYLSSPIGRLYVLTGSATGHFI